MKLNLSDSTFFQALAAAAIALVTTWILSWGFVDSTRAARWVSAADVAAVAAHAAADSASVGGAFKAHLLQ